MMHRILLKEIITKNITFDKYYFSKKERGSVAFDKKSFL
ncbi:hypothetical protein CHY_2638 [Carboxydothermus hydrogenoformans Z-2901]|uniref:Uncharacterized protein n=1 Tax=Carboxydothermus hydrogenoformans (strain ATCC BAA-161 / DSM 6008 / Z-2901) TaxID=246194 RepID=Q3A8V4_CARHZ|nr:hypothetical protein CHY_2638 [Carboxydothermus hydrogenoformans Z-2901]